MNSMTHFGWLDHSKGTAEEIITSIPLIKYKPRNFNMENTNEKLCVQFISYKINKA